MAFLLFLLSFVVMATPDPFVKSLKASEPIDLSLLAHILNDADLASSPLEGNYFVRTITYLDAYIRYRGLTPEFAPFYAKINYLLEISQELDELFLVPATFAQTRFDVLIAKIQHWILTLPDDAYCSIPGGWSNLGTGGHAMVYQFKRVESGLEFYVYNTGAGIHSHHEKHSTSVHELYAPVQVYRLPAAIHPDRLSVFLSDLLRLRLPLLRKLDEMVSPDYLYQTVLPRIHFLPAHGELVERVAFKTLKPDQFIIGQLSGTCAEQVLFELVDTGAADESFLYGYRRYALDNYMHTSPHLDDPRVQSLLSKAIVHLLRRGKTLFAPAEQEVERQALVAYRDRLLAAAGTGAGAGAGTGAGAMPSPSVPEAAVALPAPLRQTELSSVTVQARLFYPRPSALRGGSGLLAELDAYIHDCQSLAGAGEHLAIMERLEFALATLPLPSIEVDFTVPLPFYSEINKDNQEQFYEKIRRLQDIYAVARGKKVGDAVLPGSVVFGLSVIVVLDYINGLYPWVIAGAKSYHGELGAYLEPYIRTIQHNPYLAQHQPCLDARLKDIQERYIKDASKVYLDLYYQNIINSELGLRGNLLRDYEGIKPSLPAQRASLETRGVQALYVFVSQYDALSSNPIYQPLLKKFKLQMMLEHAAVYALQAILLLNEPRPFIDLTFSEIQLDFISPATKIRFSTLSSPPLLMKHHYPLAEDNIYQHALRLDYIPLPSSTAVPSLQPHTQKLCSANELQLAPAEMLHRPRNEWTAQERDLMSQQGFDQALFYQRQLVQLRAAPRHQIKLSLDYFHQHLSNLADPNCQVYLLANLFEPGLLLSEFRSNEHFFEQFDSFINKGLRYFMDQGLPTRSSNFFMRLAYAVYRYAALNHSPELARLIHLAKQLELQLAMDIEAELQYDLRRELFLTKMVIYQLGAMPDQALVDELWLCYVVLQRQKGRNSTEDMVQHLAFESAADDFMRVLSACSLAKKQSLAALAVQHLGLGTSSGSVVRLNKGLYYVTVTSGQRYCVDPDRALVFNASNMACIELPLEFAQHPSLQILKHLPTQPCFVSSGRSIYNFGEPLEWSLIRESGDVYRLQKEWILDGVLRWYELHFLSEAQKNAFALGGSVLDFSLPETLKDSQHHVWLACDGSKQALISKDMQAAYILEPNGLTEDVYSVKALDRWGAASGFSLCKVPPWPEAFFSSFEDQRFISVWQGEDGSYQLDFGRYHLRLTANFVDGAWVFRRADEPHCRLILPPGRSRPELYFENERNHQRWLYLPVQAFFSQSTPSSDSEYYAFEQDTKAHIPQTMVQEQEDKAWKASLGPWQFNAKERFIRYRLDEHQEPKASTPAKALYLCYVYLGRHQANKAWKVLNDCANTMGGLKAGLDELQILSWIFNALPFKLSRQDEAASIATPAFVACQLKALALWTQSFKPGHKLAFPSASFDPKSPNAWYENQCLRRLQLFNEQLNTNLYNVYKRYQSLRPYLEHDLQLNDRERHSLLNYYHYHLPGTEPKALGALGYEWQCLELKQLQAEALVLREEQRQKPRLSPAYQRRLHDIQAVLEKEETIYGHETLLERRPMDLKIPCGFYQMIVEKISERVGGIVRPWFEDISKAVVTAEDKAKSLSLATTEADFWRCFPHYYDLALTGRTPEQNLYFYRQCLMAHHHVALVLQSNTMVYLCNVLLRVIQNSALFQSLRKPTHLQYIFFLAEQEHVNPSEIMLYQARHTTKALMMSRPELAMSLRAEVHLPEELIIRPSAELPKAYQEESLLAVCGISAEAVLAYQRAATIFSNTQGLAQGGETLKQAEQRAGSKLFEALQEMKVAATAMLADSAVRRRLQTETHVLLDSLNPAQEAALQELLDRVNAMPSSLEQSQLKQLDLDAKLRSPLDKQALFMLYFKADKVSYAEQTGLDDAGIVALHQDLARYFQLALRQQALQRLLDKLSGVDEGTADASDWQQIAHELLTKNLVDPATDPIFSFFQYAENIIFRPQQTVTINRMVAMLRKDPYRFAEFVEKIIMGGGKTKVILPLEAKLKATGANLVVLEVPPALLETNFSDTAATSLRLFKQRAHKFEFDRAYDCSPQSLAWLHEKFLQIMLDKDYVVTTGDAVQSLEEKYWEILLQGPGEGKEAAACWEQQIDTLDKIIALFRGRADVIIDEAHQGLWFRRKLNYALGQARAVPTWINQAAISLYQFFDEVSLSEPFAGQTLAHLLVNHKQVRSKALWKPVLCQLARALVEKESSPLAGFIKDFTGDEQRDLLKYLKNEGEVIPDVVLRQSHKIRCQFAFYKEQISHLLEQTLPRNLNEHYGRSHQPMDKGGVEHALPYAGNNKPKERSRFGNYLEAINGTVQMAELEGVQSTSLKRYLSGLQAQARQESLQDPTRFASMDDTPSGTLLGLICPEFDTPLSAIHLEDEAQFATIFEQLHKNKALIYELLKKDILPQIRVETDILHSDAYNHVDIYRSVQVTTGTPWNSLTFHQRLEFRAEDAAASDGFIFHLLKAKNTAIRGIEMPADGPNFEQLFASSRGEVRALADVCALFKGISNLQVAKRLAEFIRLNPACCATPVPVQYVLFFNADDILCALPIIEGSEPFVIGSSDPKVIDERLGCGPQARFTFYDQVHTEGVDLKQDKKAKALVLVDHETQLHHFFQACMRMRGLQDEQQVEVLVPEHMQGYDLDALKQGMENNEESALEEDVFVSTFAKLANIIRNDFMNRLLACPDSAEKRRYALAFKSYFVEQEERDFFVKYGHLSQQRDTSDIFSEHARHLIDDWSEILRGLGETVSGEQNELLVKSMGDVIDKAVQHCAKQHQSPLGAEQGREVEVQNELLTDKQQQMQIQLQRFDPSLEPLPYTEWTSLPSTFSLHPSITIQPLDVLFRSIAPRFNFSGVYASYNFYATHSAETSFIGPYMKPVHAILFKPKAGGRFKALLINQQEAEELTSLLQKNPSSPLWMGTSQHTVLAGKPPEGYRDNASYQMLIEKIRFFNGEFRSLMDGPQGLPWLSEASAEKFSYFQQYLLPYREVSFDDFQALREVLSARNAVFGYILEHPFLDEKDINWYALLGEELSDGDTEDCNALVQAFARTHQDYFSVPEERTYVHYTHGLALSLPACVCLQGHIEKRLLPIKRAMSGYLTTPVLSEQFFSPALQASWCLLLPATLAAWEGGDYRCLTEFFCEKALAGTDAAWAVLHIMLQALSFELSFAGKPIVDHMLSSTGPGRLVCLQGLIQSCPFEVYAMDSTWRSLDADFLATILDTVPEFVAKQKDDVALLHMVHVFQHQEDRLKQILALSGDKPRVLHALMTILPSPTARAFINMFIPAFKIMTSADLGVLLPLLLSKLSPSDKDDFILTLLRSHPQWPSAMIDVFVAESSASIAHFNAMLSLPQQYLSSSHLMNLINKLPSSEERSRHFIYPLLSHDKVNVELLALAVNELMLIPLSDSIWMECWQDLIATKTWGTLEKTILANLLCYFAQEESFLPRLFGSTPFKAQQNTIVNQWIASQDPALYAILLKASECIVLSAEQLQACLRHLRAMGNQMLLPTLAGYPGIDEETLLAIIAYMQAPMAATVDVLMRNPKLRQPLLFSVLLKRLDLADAKVLVLNVLDEEVSSELLAFLLSEHLARDAEVYQKILPQKQLQGQVMDVLLDCCPASMVDYQQLIKRFPEHVSEEQLLIMLMAVQEHLSLDFISFVLQQRNAVATVKLFLWQNLNPKLQTMLIPTEFWSDFLNGLDWSAWPGDFLAKLVLYFDTTPQLRGLFFSSQAFIEHQATLVEKLLDGEDKAGVITTLVRQPLSFEVLQHILRHEAPSLELYTALLEQAALTAEQLEMMLDKLPTKDVLLLLIAHPKATTELYKKLTPYAVSINDEAVWAALFAQQPSLDLSAVSSSDLSDAALSTLMSSITGAQGLSFKDRALLRPSALRVLAPTVQQLDLSAMKLSSSAVIELLDVLPSSVTGIAVNGASYASPIALRQKYSENCFFKLHCLSAMACLAAGSALLVLGILLLQPIALAVGAGLLGLGAVYLGCQFFACKKKPPSLWDVSVDHHPVPTS